MVTHIGMAIDTLFCKEPEVTDWSKTKNATHSSWSEHYIARFQEMSN